MEQEGNARKEPADNDSTNLAASFARAISIVEVPTPAAPLETDLDAVMTPPLSASLLGPSLAVRSKPDFVPRLQLNGDDSDQECSLDDDADDKEVFKINSQRISEDSSYRSGLYSLPEGPDSISGGSAREYSSSRQLPPPPLMLLSRRLMRYRRGRRVSDKSLPPYRPRILQQVASSNLRSKSPPGPTVEPDPSRLRELIKRVDAFQKSLEAMEKRRRLAWEARKLHAQSQELRRNVKELLGDNSAPVNHLLAPNQRPVQRTGGVGFWWRFGGGLTSGASSASVASTPRSSGGCCSNCSCSCHSSTYSCANRSVRPEGTQSAAEVLNRLLQIRRDIVRRTENSNFLPPPSPPPLSSSGVSSLYVGSGAGVACR